MEAHEASALEVKRWVRIVGGIAAAVALAPVAGMVLAFAIMPALPFLLALGFVLGPINWLEDREVGDPEEGDEPVHDQAWFAAHGLPAHA